MSLGYHISEKKQLYGDFENEIRSSWPIMCNDV